MGGFTKLVPEIILSSIWNEPSDIRIVWITMLATKDENGYVQGNARTIGRLANVPTDQAEEALRIFQTPDPSSKTSDNEGRRIIPAPGGWIVLNHQIYRVRDEVQREQTRERVRRFREKQSVTLCNVTDTLPSASASASSSACNGDCQGEDKKTKRKPYGEFQGVKLTDDEYKKLLDAQGETRLTLGIEILDDYMRAKGKRYKDHYAVMKKNSWVWQRVDQATGTTHPKPRLVV